MVVVELEHEDEEVEVPLADSFESVGPVSEFLELALHGVSVVVTLGVLAQAVVDDPVIPDLPTKVHV